MRDSAEVKRVFDAPIDKVFEAFINPEFMDKWHHPDGFTSKNKVNGEKSYEVEMSNNSMPQVGIISGEYLEFNRPNRLVFTWSWNWNPGMSPTTVTVDFKSLSDNTTEVVLVHSGFATEEDTIQHETGWGMSFNNLAKVLRGGEK